MKLAAAGFLVPFIFIYDNTLLLQGAIPDIIFSVITALVGCVVLAVALFRWAFKDLSWVESLLLMPCAIVLVMPRPVWINIVGFAAAAIVIGRAYYISKHKPIAA